MKGRRLLKFVNAKFAFPHCGKKRGRFKKSEIGDGWEEIEEGFVCLDLLEYPGEHSDVIIGFGCQLVRFLEHSMVT